VEVATIALAAFQGEHDSWAHRLVQVQHIDSPWLSHFLTLRRVAGPNRQPRHRAVLRMGTAHAAGTT
jgi:hypothetical protein